MSGALVLLSMLGTSMGIIMHGTVTETVMEYKDQCMVVLDCPFSLHPAENDSISVKWYYSHGATTGALIYSWDWGYAPKAYGTHKDIINAQFEADADTYQQFRAVQLITPPQHFSGHYECHVSSKYSSAVYKQDLFIWSRPTLSVSVERTGAGDDYDTLVMNTAVAGMYPEPSEWRMWWYPPDQESSVKFDRVEGEWMEGYYDASYRVEVPRWEMENGEAHEFYFSIAVDRVGEVFTQSATYNHVQ